MTKHGLSATQRAELKTIRPDGPDGCWVWTGSKTKKGHGCMKVEGKLTTLHRHVYEEVRGVKLPTEVFVRHTCDNPPCWNPAHLTTGSTQDNMDDMTARERQSKGSHRPAAKLTEKTVAAMKLDRALGMKQHALAAKYKVSQSNVSRALNGQQWKHVSVDTDAAQVFHADAAQP